DNATTILLGIGDGTFALAPGSPITVGGSPGNLVAADLNGDGKLDLAIPNFLSGTVTILLGNGDGTFPQASGPPMLTGGEPNSIAVGDFNGDGRVDLVVQNQFSANNIVIFLGNGDGTFAPFSSTNVAKTGPMAVADFKGDGRLGLATAASRRKDGESSPRFTGRGRHDTTPFTIPFTTHPRGWLSRVAVEGGSTTLNESVMAMAQSAQAFRVRAERKLKLS